MQDNEFDPGFSWSSLFLITGISFLIFCALLLFLNGYYPVVFLWIGIGSTIAGLIVWAGSLLMEQKT